MCASLKMHSIIFIAENMKRTKAVKLIIMAFGGYGLLRVLMLKLTLTEKWDFGYGHKSYTNTKNKGRLISGNPRHNEYKYPPLGRFDYEQMKFIYENPSHRNKCVELYKHGLHVTRRGYTEYAKIIEKEIHHTIFKLSIDESGMVQPYTIQETVGDRDSCGGSCFRVEMRGMDNAICTTKDYMNGTYTVFCPVIDSCATITIELKYLHFDAYISENIASFDKMIYSDVHWCPDKPGFVAYVGGDLCYHKRPQDGSVGMWHYTNGQWSWVENGCIVKPMNAGEIQQCLKSFHAIHFIGDSHLRFLTDYFITMEFGAREHRLQKTGDSRQGNLYFWWGGLVQHGVIKVQQIQNNMYRNKELTNKDVIVISMGAWDMRFKGLQSYLRSFNNTFMPRLRNLLQEYRWSKAKVIFVNSHPFPPDVNLIHRAGYRNNFAIPAANYWIKSKLQKLGVTVVDAFSIVNMRYKENVCRHHYMCSQINEKSKIVEHSGSVGYKVADVILSNICS